MGRVKTVIPFILALVVALVATVYIYRWVQTQETAPPVQERAAKEEKHQVALAGRDMPWGTPLTPDMIRLASLPKELAPAGHFTSLADLQGRVLVRPVSQNEPITESKLAPTSVTTGGVSAVVSHGKRAIAVAGDKVIGLSGFIQPGNRVDILVTVRNPQGEQEPVTKLVLSDVLVLATGTQVQGSDGGKPAPVDVFTVEVTPEEAERLSLAATQGRLHFALRNVTDKEIVFTAGATVPEALKSYSSRLARVEAPSAEPSGRGLPERLVFEVQTIKGTQVSTQTF